MDNQTGSSSPADNPENTPRAKSSGDEAAEITSFVDSPGVSPAEHSTRPRWIPGQTKTGLSHDIEERPRIRWREPLGVLCLIALADLTVYRGTSKGFTGFALLFVGAPLFMWLASSRRAQRTALCVIAAMLLCLAVKLVWCGSAAITAIGYVLLIAFAAALAGYCPHVLQVIAFGAQVSYAGLFGMIDYGRIAAFRSPEVPRVRWLNFILPIVTAIAFGCLFVFANPDLVKTFGEGFERILEAYQRWLRRFSPDWFELCFWFVTFWIVAGLLRPILAVRNFAEPSTNGHAKAPSAAVDSTLYAAFRNTLVTVIGLFAVYLVFEFTTLWFRDFPPGFYYSGYAHEGAAWLTAALALATVVLSMVFHKGILDDRRVATLRRLAWIWSAENLLLALAVYNRLHIYIGFNGLSRMRIVGIYGISAVVVGFILVLRKIARRRSFQWLIQRQLWTLSIAVYLLALTPRDAIVVGYNVRRILAGDPAPAVQISVHPINSEGILLLRPLLNSDNEIIREGIHAMLAQRNSQLQANEAARRDLGWRTFQWADRIAAEELHQDAALWEKYEDYERRDAALARFHEYSYQWF